MNGRAGSSYGPMEMSSAKPFGRPTEGLLGNGSSSSAGASSNSPSDQLTTASPITPSSSSTLAHAMKYSGRDRAHHQASQRTKNDGVDLLDGLGKTHATDSTTRLDQSMDIGDSMTTPEAQWGSTSAAQASAPLVTLTNEALADQELFDPNNRPYTPSYSAGDFSDILSDQQDFLNNVGDQIDSADFAFDNDVGASTRSGLAPSFDYDPDSADGYNHLNATLLAQNFLGNQNFAGGSSYAAGQQSGSSSEALAPPAAAAAAAAENDPVSASISAQQDNVKVSVPTFAFSQESDYRNTSHETQASPQASPLLGPISSPLHTRHSSFGSNADFSPNPSNSEGDPAFQQMQTLGQRMTLHDPIVPRQSDDSLERQSFNRQTNSTNPLFFAPVFEEEGQEAGSEQRHDGQDGTSSTSAAFPSYTYGMPPPHDATSASGSVPALSMNDSTIQYGQGHQSQQIIDVHQSDPRAFRFPSRPQAGWAASGSVVSSSPYASDLQAAPYASLVQPNTFGGHESSLIHRPVSSGESAEQMSSSQEHSQSQHQQQQDPKRQDSYDRVRKFIRLDVDMGFQGEREAVNVGGPQRKRSNSDVGPLFKEGDDQANEFQEPSIPSPPPFAVVPGGVTDKTPIAMSSGVDWATEAAKQRRLQQFAALGFQPSTSSLDSDSLLAVAMDPHLLQQQYGVQQHEPASGPVRQREGSMSGRGAGPYPGHNRTASSGSLTPFSASGMPSEQQGLVQPQASQGLHRSLSSRSVGRNRHARSAQSEDLSQLARMGNPTEFLNRITAPDGSLAPPMAQSGMNMPPPSIGARNSLSRINTAVSGAPQAGFATAPIPYGSGRLFSAGDNAQHLQALNRYGSIRSTSSPQGTQPIYSQTYSPTYGALEPMGRTPKVGSSPYEIEASAYPIVQQVTTSATQIASASRRKNEAIHVCPIPGCGSTFTRKFNLNGHIRSHTGQRPYHCRAPGCGKSFARSFDLSRHEKLHAGIKPHTCESCGKAFARADALSRHLRNDAGNGGCSARLSDAESTVDGSSSSQLGIVESAPLANTMTASVTKTDDKDGSRKESRFKGHVL